MINLKNLTDEQLEREIERRKLNKSIPVPEPLTEPNWLPVYKMVLDYISQLDAQGWVDDDLQHYIFEAAMESVYGDDVWKFINSRS